LGPAPVPRLSDMLNHISGRTHLERLVLVSDTSVPWRASLMLYSA